MFGTIGSLLAQQSVPQGYYDYLKTIRVADSLYALGEFEQAAVNYGRINRLKLGNETINSPNSHYNAACAWSLAKKNDSAFAELNILIIKKRYSNLKQLSSDKDFEIIKSDPRWNSILKIVNQNIEFEKKLNKRISVSSDFKDYVFYPMTETVKRYLTNDTLPFLNINFNNYRIYFRGDKFGTEELEELKTLISAAYWRSINLLNLERYQRGIYLILLSDQKEMKSLTGHSPFGGFAMAGHDCVVFNINAKKTAPPITHEIFHLISLQSWGNCNSRLLIEGSAVYAQNECGNYLENPINALCAYMKQEKRLFTFQELVSNFNEKAKRDEVGVYFQSAGIFKYLYETYGVEKMKQLWELGFNSFEAIYGKTISAFEEEWLSHIEEIPVPLETNWSTIFSQGCQELLPKE